MGKQAVVIGNGGFAVNCLKALLEHNSAADVRLVVSDPEAQAMRGLLERFCADHNIAHAAATNVNQRELVERIEALEPDYLFSIYNMRIMKERLLSVPRLGTINFHNGPLPKYRGVNVYSWAIIHGETEYGVTWHLVDQGIDTGDILAQQMFPMDPHETPNTLMAKGFRVGVQLLEELLPALASGDLAGRAQDKSEASYFSKVDLPNGGRVSVHWEYEEVERFLRGLDFRPLPNHFVYPTLSFRGQPFHPQSVVRQTTDTTTNPGRIVGVDDSWLCIEIADGVVGVGDLLNSELIPTSPWELQQSLGIQIGDFVDVATRELDRSNGL